MPLRTARGSRARAAHERVPARWPVVVESQGSGDPYSAHEMPLVSNQCQRVPFSALCRNNRSAPGRIRTSDSRFRKPLLYPLSYRRKCESHHSIGFSLLCQRPLSTEMMPIFVALAVVKLYRHWVWWVSRLRYVICDMLSLRRGQLGDNYGRIVPRNKLDMPLGGPLIFFYYLWLPDGPSETRPFPNRSAG